MSAHAQQAAEPQRLYRIGDVSRLTGTKPFVLRFWETEFPMLQPVKTPKGHRLYRQQDIDLIRAIKRLLYEERFTIPGARRHLSEMIANGERLAGLLEGAGGTMRPHDAGATMAGSDSSSGSDARELLSPAPPARPARRLAAFEQLELQAAESADAYRALLAVRDELRAILTLLATR
jgi:DNA-binding transcriptional MerR regulator